MVLIRKVKVATRNPPFLEDVEHSDSLGDREAVVLAAVDDEVGGGELQNVFWG